MRLRIVVVFRFGKFSFLSFFIYRLVIKDALPTQVNLSDNEIPDNDIDFAKELPNESEYYHTSTDRDEFVRPTLTQDDANSEIDGSDDDGIDLDDDNNQAITPSCIYELLIIENSGHVKRLDIKLRGLKVQSNRKSNVSLDDFVAIAQQQIFNDIKTQPVMQETLNEITSKVRQVFKQTYGYDDNCGVSIVLNSEYTVSGNDKVDESEGELKIETVTEPNVEVDVEEATTVESTIEFDDVDDISDTTDEYQPRILTFPKQSPNIKAIIDAYKALNNWKFSTK